MTQKATKAAKAAKKSAAKAAKKASKKSATKAAKKTPNYSAPALEKGLDILEILADSAAGYTLNEISKLSNKSINEIFRMVMTLHRRGWV